MCGLALGAAWSAVADGCKSEPVDARPDRAVEEFVLRMQRVHGDPKTARAGVRAPVVGSKKNLAERAKRASSWRDARSLRRRCSRPRASRCASRRAATRPDRGRLGDRHDAPAKSPTASATRQVRARGRQLARGARSAAAPPIQKRSEDAARALNTKKNARRIRARAFALLTTRSNQFEKKIASISVLTCSSVCSRAIAISFTISVRAVSSMRRSPNESCLSVFRR